MQLAAFLCVICAICGRITRKSTLSIAKEETPMSLADLADLRRQKTVRSNVSAKADAADNAEKDNYHIVETIQFMLFAVSLRNNAACCIPLRDLRYLRENIHMRVLNVSAQGNPNVSRRFR